MLTIDVTTSILFSKSLVVVWPRNPVANSCTLCLSIPVANDNIHFTWPYNRIKTFIKQYHETITEINILFKQFLETQRKAIVNNISRLSSSKSKLFCSSIIRKQCAEPIRNVIVWIVRELRNSSFQRPYNLSLYNLNVSCKCFNCLPWWLGYWWI